MQRMRPLRMWIDGTCFNLPVQSRRQKKLSGDKISETENKLPDEHELFNITKKDDKEYCTTFHLPKQYNKKIDSHPYFNIAEFQTRTNTKLSLEQNGNIEILGQDYDLVAAAREEMHDLVINLRKIGPPLQFLAIPTLNAEIHANFKIFKEEILSIKGIKGLHETIFQDPAKLHLTIGVMTLLDETEISEAKNILESHRSDLIENLKTFNQPMINVKGIGCMQSNFEKVNVLYAKAALENETDEVNLQKIVNNVFNCFYEIGFMKENNENVKVHLTLMNTKYRDDKRSKQWSSRRIPFDASTIMEKYENYDFGKTPLDKIQICLMHSKNEDGFYKTISEIQL